jgi:hypothetical protein
MLKVGHDIFALVLNFLGIYWQPKRIALGQKLDRIIGQLCMP